MERERWEICRKICRKVCRKICRKICRKVCRKMRTVFVGRCGERGRKFVGKFVGRFVGKFVGKAYYSPLLVFVCRSVSQDPPRPIEDITVVFGLLYSPSTALSQSAATYVHVASGRPISDRLSPLFYRLFYRSPCVNIY